MSLSYYFCFTAPAGMTATKLKAFLDGVEVEAKKMGFAPTLVVDATFDTAERREFAKRITYGMPLEDERLKGVAVPNEPALTRHDPEDGNCRLLPSRGVVLVVTDQYGAESAFGFFQYAETVRDIHGRTLAETGLAGRWHFSEFVDSPDPRFRKIVKLFAEAGYLASEKDEFRAGEG